MVDGLFHWKRFHWKGESCFYWRMADAGSIWKTGLLIDKMLRTTSSKTVKTGSSLCHSGHNGQANQCAIEAGALKKPPPLGANVWAEIQRSNIRQDRTCGQTLKGRLTTYYIFAISSVTKNGYQKKPNFYPQNTDETIMKSSSLHSHFYLSRDNFFSSESWDTFLD